MFQRNACACRLIARVRADEQRIQHDGRECVCARTEQDTRERLRAQVEALHAPTCLPEIRYRSDVLALLDGGTR